MFLHAWRLQFDHPSTGERISQLTEAKRILLAEV